MSDVSSGTEPLSHLSDPKQFLENIKEISPLPPTVKTAVDALRNAIEAFELITSPK